MVVSEDKKYSDRDLYRSELCHFHCLIRAKQPLRSCNLCQSTNPGNKMNETKRVTQRKSFFSTCRLENYSRYTTSTRHRAEVPTTPPLEPFTPAYPQATSLWQFESPDTAQDHTPRRPQNARSQISPGRSDDSAVAASWTAFSWSQHWLTM